MALTFKELVANIQEGKIMTSECALLIENGTSKMVEILV
jgi:hypothetical protein